MKVEVEVRNLNELLAALSEKPDIVLLDNMSPALLRESVKLIREHQNVRIEASGGVTEATIREIAETGVDYISMGALTHSVQAADISLRYAHAD
jgi:nicotinate-nucleotide pyrophosphorylase (carboxylating)